MKQRLIFFSFFLMLAAGISTTGHADSMESGGEGYAAASYKDLSQTIAMMGGVDITNPKVVDDYTKIFYCEQYQKSFKNDLEWHKIRSLIIDRVQHKKDYFRTLYETYGTFQLGRYDMEGKFFPLVGGTALMNVGSIVLFSYDQFTPYCRLRKASDSFPSNITLLLKRPLTLNSFRVPMDEAKELLSRMVSLKDEDRKVYSRIRFHVLETPGLFMRMDRVVGTTLKGEITAIDFFLDQEMTRPVGPTQLLWTR